MYLGVGRGGVDELFAAGEDSGERKIGQKEARKFRAVSILSKLNGPVPSEDRDRGAAPAARAPLASVRRFEWLRVDRGESDAREPIVSARKVREIRLGRESRDDAPSHLAHGHKIGA